MRVVEQALAALDVSADEEALLLVELAQKRFDESLELDSAGGAREFFLGEHHRHAGYLRYFAGNLNDALGHFEKSLAHRKRIGAIDPAMSAAWTLGSVLVEAGRFVEAEMHLSAALATAACLNSPVGISRAALAIGQLREADRSAEQAVLEPVGSSPGFVLAR